MVALWALPGQRYNTPPWLSLHGLRCLQLLKSTLGPLMMESKGVGCDVQLTVEVNMDDATFVERNFTDQEIEHCRSQPDPRCCVPACRGPVGQTSEPGQSYLVNSLWG